MMKRIMMLGMLILIMTVAGCGNATDDIYGDDVHVEYHQPEENDEGPSYDFDKQFSEPEIGDTMAVLHTNYGDITLKLFPEVAPLAVENFVTHIEEGYYDGLTFHRVIKDFMIQGGDPAGNGTGGVSIYGEPFEDELSVEYLVYGGSLCMANSGEDTNTSQFFIVDAGPDDVDPEWVTQLETMGYPEEIINNYETYGGCPWLFYYHTVFGHVIEGLDTVKMIASVDVEPGDLPSEPVIIESAETYIVN